MKPTDPRARLYFAIRCSDGTWLAPDRETRTPTPSLFPSWLDAANAFDVAPEGSTFEAFGLAQKVRPE